MRWLWPLFAAILFPYASLWASCPQIAYTSAKDHATAESRFADAVFEAFVDSATKEETQVNYAMRYVTSTATLIVTKVHKGVVDDRVVLEKKAGDCQYIFQSGRRYLVYARRGRQGELRVDHSSGAVPLEEAAEHLEYFKTTGALCGRLTRTNGDPVGGAKVFAYQYRKHEKREELITYFAQSQPDGTYRLGLLPAGRYVLGAVFDSEDPPLLLKSYYMKKIPRDWDDGNTEVVAPHDACWHDMEMIVQPRTMLRGRVVTEDGSPLPAGRIQVTLMNSVRLPAGHPYPLNIQVIAAPDGTFEMHRVPYGVFYLVAHHFPTDRNQPTEWGRAELRVSPLRQNEGLEIKLHRRRDVAGKAPR